MIHLIGISNKYNLAASACISSSFSTVIHLMYQINNNCCNEPFAVLLCSYLYLDMHGLVFETSICYWQNQPGTTYHFLIKSKNIYSLASISCIIILDLTIFARQN